MNSPVLPIRHYRHCARAYDMFKAYGGMEGEKAKIKKRKI
jgi:hypothetical protein